MKYFASCTTLDELKKEYRRLAMMYHPDRGGNLEIMQQVNAEHDNAFEILKKKVNAKAEAGQETTETPEEFREIIEKLIRMVGINVELCGSWLWISGDTYTNREALRDAGCRWAKSKKMWYWRHEGNAHRRGGKLSIEAIREKYGSETLVKGNRTGRIMATC